MDAEPECLAVELADLDVEALLDAIPRTMAYVLGLMAERRHRPHQRDERRRHLRRALRLLLLLLHAGNQMNRRESR